MSFMLSLIDIVYMLAAAVLGSGAVALVLRSRHTKAVHLLESRLSKSEAAREHAAVMLANARRQAAFHQEELRLTRQRTVRAPAPMTETPLAPTSLDLSDIVVGLPAHGFQDTQPFTAGV